MNFHGTTLSVVYSIRYSNNIYISTKINKKERDMRIIPNNKQTEKEVKYVLHTNTNSLFY